MVAWAPKFLSTGNTPEVTVMRTELADLRAAESRLQTEADELRLSQEGLKYRVRELERQFGYNGTDPDSDDNQKRRRDRQK